MKPLGWLLCASVLLAGCAWLHQAGQDYQRGRATPLAAGEVSPIDRAKQDTAPLGALPYGGVVTGAAAFLLGFFYTWQRGRRLRLQQPPTVPIITPIIHGVATVAAGLYEHGADGSAAKRSWKTVVSGLFAYAVTLIPQVNAWVSTSHWKFAGTLTALTAVIMGLEKTLSKVPPMTP